MSPEERAYFESRAEAEIMMAQHAQHAEAVQAHYQMANHYLDRIHGHLEPAQAHGA